MRVEVLKGGRKEVLVASADGCVPTVAPNGKMVALRCVHDNANGGIQATLGGVVTAVENVIQHNVGGAAENGLFAGVPNPEDSQFANALTTRSSTASILGTCASAENRSTTVARAARP